MLAPFSEKEINKQVMIAVEEANAILFMVDAATSITDLDESMADVTHVAPPSRCSSL